MSYARQRQETEAALGLSLGGAFERNAAFVTHDAVGADDDSKKVRDILRLRVPFGSKGKDAPVTISRETDDEGRLVTAYLSFGTDWENHWMYEGEPDQEGHRLVPCTKSETGEFIPIPPKQPGASYDPTSDENVARLAKPWIRNLDNGWPEVSRSSSRVRSLARSTLKRLMR